MHARAALIDVVLREAVAQRTAGALGARLGAGGRRRLRPRRAAPLLRRRHPGAGAGAARMTPERARVEQLVAFLWDIGLEVGHSVRTVAECAEESAADVGVMTTLMEARLLAGTAELLGGDARRARAGADLAGAGVLRGQGARAAGAAPEGQRHRLQPRAQRQDRSRRAARHPDHRLGGQAPLRRRHAR